MVTLLFFGARSTGIATRLCDPLGFVFFLCDVDVDVFFFQFVAWFELDKRSVEKMSRFLDVRFEWDVLGVEYLS